MSTGWMQIWYKNQNSHVDNIFGNKFSWYFNLTNNRFTGKSFSEALIFASVNPQYDKRLFIEFPEKYKFTTCCVQKLFFCFCFDIQNNICTQHVLNLYFSGNSMNNLSSYCGLTDSRMRASDKDLPVCFQIWISRWLLSTITIIADQHFCG